ncbi:unnamed protein product [Macrosiphum euphorbiae]|uniref:Uncharacterized protein n=1 Tax=Macrosiphum euphorbiae TaxID=13131 RepID=A0AAV0WWC1_9HEMI|nr:unnamed protein product [Macrosiphum euphorbiae]
MTATALVRNDAPTIDIMSSGSAPACWSDTIFIKDFLSKVKKRKTPVLDEVVPHAKYFLNVYYTGTANEDHLVTSMLCLWSYMKVNQRPLIPDVIKGTDKWPTAPQSIKVTQVPNKRHSTVKSTGHGARPKEKTFEGASAITMSEDKVKKFYGDVYDGLDNENLKDIMLNYWGSWPELSVGWWSRRQNL